jgi:hypothetical protein
LDRPDQFYGDLSWQVASSGEGNNHLTECDIEHLITCYRHFAMTPTIEDCIHEKFDSKLNLNGCYHSVWNILSYT